MVAFRDRPDWLLAIRYSLNLLHFDNSALIFKLLAKLGGLVLRDALFDGFAAGLDEVLGFFQAKARDGANFFDDVDLLLATRLQDNREFGLLFDSSSGRCSR